MEIILEDKEAELPLFVHVPKTGGLAIRSMLEISDPCGHFPLRSQPSIERRFVFAFVRNPWDRLVSAFFYLKAGGSNVFDFADQRRYLEGLNTFSEFVHAFFQNVDFFFNQQHLKSQTFYLETNNVVKLNFLGRFERFRQDAEELCAILGVKYKEVRMNQSHHLDYKTYYTRELEVMVGEIYKEDIATFGYVF